MSEDDDLIALYRVSARERPGASIDTAIVGAAHAATRRRRRMPMFAVACAAMLVVLAALATRQMTVAPVAHSMPSSYGLREGSARMLLLDPQALRETAAQQRPGMSDGL